MSAHAAPERRFLKNDRIPTITSHTIFHPSDRPADAASSTDQHG